MNSNRLILALIVALFTYFISSNAWSLAITGVTGTFTPAAPRTLTGWSASVVLGGTTGGATPLAANTPGVTIQYTTSAGVLIGGPLPVTVGAGGVVTVPPPPIPAAAAGLGNKVIISEPVFGSTKPIVWYNSALIWGTTPKIKVDPLGFPGASTQHWFIQDTGGASLTGNDSVFGMRTLDVAASGFDLSYSLVGGSLFDLTVTGNDSFIRLSDGTYLSFPDGSNFGTMQISSGIDSGLFNFSAIGLSGTWSYDPTTNYTGADATDFTPFNASAITAVPEPPSLSLLGAGALGLFGGIWRKRRGVHGNKPRAAG